MKFVLAAKAACLSCFLCACGNAASTPARLAQALQQAFDRGDFEAAGTLVDFAAAPGELQFFYYDQVRECAGEAKCTVAPAPLDDEFRAQIAEQARQEGAEAPRVDGVIEVVSKAVDGSGSGTLKMPYAKTGADYRIVSMRIGATELARRRARSAEQELASMLADGIYDSATQTRRTDWAQAATRLPADGGEAGAALLRQTRAMAAAVDAHDPDRAMHAGGRIAQLMFSDRGYDGKPIALEPRRNKLRVQSLRMLREVKVLGGYQLGDDAALAIEARDGVGWSQRGAILLSRDGGDWDVSGKRLVALPPQP